MTDKEIIKALECLFGYVDCRKCPYSQMYKFPLCQRQVAKDTLNLITRQQAEIERLEKQKEISNSELAKAINKSLEQAKEIGNFKAELNGYMLEPRKRTALDGKVWWCVFDTNAWKWSTLWCFGKYKTKKDCQIAINSYKKLSTK